MTGDPTRLLKMAGDAVAPQGRPYDVGVVHIDIVPGDGVRLTVASKGFGAENMSALRMLVPADGVPGIIDVRRRDCRTRRRQRVPADHRRRRHRRHVRSVGAAGEESGAARSDDPAIRGPISRELESDLLDRVNALGIGPQGLGGRVTALAVNIEVLPTHIAGLPVAVNLGCHSTRRMTVEL